MKEVNLVNITETAQAYFAQLLLQENVPGTQIRMGVVAAGTPDADVDITFCPPGKQKISDFIQNFQAFRLFIDQSAEAFLAEARIHFENDGVGGGELTIKAPHLKSATQQAPPLEVTAQWDSATQIEHIIETEINPGLASHGGQVRLLEFLTEEGIAILQFGGGCHGCGMANVTLKQGIEKTLTTRLPFVTGVRDVTDHTQGKNPYY